MGLLSIQLSLMQFPPGTPIKGMALAKSLHLSLALHAYTAYTIPHILSPFLSLQYSSVSMLFINFHTKLTQELFLEKSPGVTQGFFLRYPSRGFCSLRLWNFQCREMWTPLDWKLFWRVCTPSDTASPWVNLHSGCNFMQAKSICTV